MKTLTGFRFLCSLALLGAAVVAGVLLPDPWRTLLISAALGGWLFWLHRLGAGERRVSRC